MRKLPVIIILFFTQPILAQTALDEDAQFKENKERVSSVFKEMAVVQRKAKEKSGKWLFNTGLTFDFSDGPISMYAISTNFGYAISDFWEVYLNYVPSFLISERAIVNKVSSIGDGSYRITYSKPKSQMGIDLLWLPAYGKDSWSAYRIVRSDTFFKLSVGQIAYESDNGLRYGLLMGKTFFISEYFNLRLAAGFHYMQTIVDNDKKFNPVAIIESGLVFYF